MTPFSVVVDSGGFAYVSDFDFGTPHRIQKFRKNVVGVGQMPAPDSFMQGTRLFPGWPNPFRGVVSIPYALRADGRVSVRVYDIVGNLVRVLVDEFQVARGHIAYWDGVNEVGRVVADGVYVVELCTPDRVLTEKVVRVK
jgi:hypothetical protein